VRVGGSGRVWEGLGGGERVVSLAGLPLAAPAAPPRRLGGLFTNISFFIFSANFLRVLRVTVRAP